jgi:hypothetical protein
MSTALGRGLVDVPTEQLTALFRAQVRGELNCPLTAWEIARHGLQSWQAELLDGLRGLPAEGVRAVLVAVLAERKAAAEREKR